MKFIIIGLGNFGSALAEGLSKSGHEVIGVDISENKVETIKNKIATGFVIDATDDMSLNVLPVDEVDAVIVAIGENFGASIRVIAVLKQKKVAHIYARAIDPVHEVILEGFGIDRILTPERDAADTLVNQLDLSIKMERFRISKEYSVCKFVAPDKFVDHSIGELNRSEEFGLKIIAVERAEKVANFFGVFVTEHNDVADNVEYIVQEGDKLVCYGEDKDFRSFWKMLA